MADVMVAMSGGVDSSVAAALLVQSGHRVTGVTLKLRSGPLGEAPTQGCCTARDALDARRVADALGIPYYVFDMTDDFREAVIEPFVDGYLRGWTPNPCVECNRHLKFSLLLDRAAGLGCDMIATGHHVRIRGEPPLRRMLRAVDPAKDQSYVLYMLGQDVLARCAFPVGEMTKARVRDIAASLGLRTATKPDSQDVCFLGRGGVREFMREFMMDAPGDRLEGGAVVDTQGHVLGRHDGPFFTIGQRRGLGLARGRRVFVTEVRPEGTVVVGNDADLWKSRLHVEGLNWVAGAPPEGAVGVQARYRGDCVPCTVRQVGTDQGPYRGTNRSQPGGVVVELAQPLRAPAPGQAAVFYRGDEMLGGGTITTAF